MKCLYKKKTTKKQKKTNKKTINLWKKVYFHLKSYSSTNIPFHLLIHCLDLNYK